MLLHEAKFVSEQVAAERRGAILFGLNTSVVGSLLFTVPPVEEQLETVGALAQYLAPLEDASEKIGSTVIGLSEYRAALINSAVTGKIAGLQ